MTNHNICHNINIKHILRLKSRYIHEKVKDYNENFIKKKKKENEKNKHNYTH